eukprot:scaffold2339_cov20-Tisochrysis_lutea.AAC.2
MRMESMEMGISTSTLCWVCDAEYCVLQTSVCPHKSTLAWTNTCALARYVYMRARMRACMMLASNVMHTPEYTHHAEVQVFA